MIENLKKVLDLCNERDRLIIKLLVMLAMTPRGICALKREHYKADVRQLFVPLVNRPGISDWVTLPKQLSDEIKRWLWLQEHKDPSRIFLLSSKRICQIVNDAGTRAGLKICPRSLRALAIDRLLAAAEFARFTGPIGNRIRSVDFYNDDRDHFVTKHALLIEEHLGGNNG